MQTTSAWHDKPKSQEGLDHPEEWLEILDIRIFQNYILLKGATMCLEIMNRHETYIYRHWWSPAT